MCTPTAASRPRQLVCCCCGAATRGRQWWNRDTGFGICDRCATEQAEHEEPERMRSLYGEAGVHYRLPPA